MKHTDCVDWAVPIQSFLAKGLDITADRSPRAYGAIPQELPRHVRVVSPAEEIMADQIKSLGPPPAEIELVYKQIGKSHVFTAPRVGGFYYGSSSLKKTFNEAAKALSLHVSRLYNVKAEYNLGSSLSAFETHLAADDDDDASELLVKNVVIATKSSENSDTSCH